MRKKHLTLITHLLILTQLQPIQAQAKQHPMAGSYDTLSQLYQHRPNLHSTTKQQKPTIDLAFQTFLLALLTIFTYIIITIIRSYTLIPNQKNNPPTHQKPTLQVPQQQVVPKAQPKIKAQTNIPNPFYIPLLLLLLLLAIALIMLLLPLLPVIDLIMHLTPEPIEYEDDEDEEEDDKKTYKIKYIHDRGKGGRKKSSSLLPRTISKAKGYYIFIVFKYANTPPKKKESASVEKRCTPALGERSGRSCKVQINVPEKDRPDELARYTGTSEGIMDKGYNMKSFAPRKPFTLIKIFLSLQVELILASLFAELKDLTGYYTY